MFKERLRRQMWVLDYTPMPDQQGSTVLSPLHYGDTLEIVLLRGIEGEMLINGKSFRIEGKRIFIIPPGTLHAATYFTGGKRSEDIIAAFHINIDALRPVLDIEQLLSLDQRSLFTLPTVCKDFDEVQACIRSVLDENSSKTHALQHLLSLFDLICQSGGDATYSSRGGKEISRLVNWIEQHFTEQITLNDAAAYFGYNKYYFCKWIRRHTGVSFSNFVNAIRINYACTLLLSGYSVEECTEKCGYYDTSHFIKVFKKFTNQTPGKYTEQKQQNNKWAHPSRKSQTE